MEERNWQQELRGRVLVLAAPPILLPVVGGYLVSQAAQVDARCEDRAQVYLPDYAMLGVALLAILAGRYVGPRLHREPLGSRGRTISDAAGILAIGVLFAAAAGALIYEAVGVRESAGRDLLQVLKRVQELEPITHYVRCAIYHDKQGGRGYWTYSVLVLTGFLVGHWLWPSHPARVVPVPAAPPTGRAIASVPLAAIGTLSALVLLVGANVFLLSFAFSESPLGLTGAGSNPGDASYKVGVTLVVAFVFILFWAISLLDILFAVRRWNSIALRVQEWSRLNPWFSYGLLLLVFMLLTHFLANPVHY
jgi:hypothetical protein